MFCQELQVFVQELQESEPDTDEGPRAMALSFLSQTFGEACLFC